MDNQPCDGETDAEIEQMHDDVPALRVFALELHMFNGQRVLLG